MFITMEVETVLLVASFRVLGPVATVDASLELLSLHSPNAAVLDINLRGELVTRWPKHCVICKSPSSLPVLTRDLMKLQGM